VASLAVPEWALQPDIAHGWRNINHFDALQTGIAHPRFEVSNLRLTSKPEITF
jgi:hypothetical protein